jgi:hypothetical protein
MSCTEIAAQASADTKLLLEQVDKLQLEASAATSNNWLCRQVLDNLAGVSADKARTRINALFGAKETLLEFDTTLPVAAGTHPPGSASSPCQDGVEGAYRG